LPRRSNQPIITPFLVFSTVLQLCHSS